MKIIFKRISSSPNYTKTLEWGKLITITGGAQVLVQLTTFASGILVIRLLSTQEYALFTLANTMLGTMIILADSGIANGVMAESGKVWQNRKQLGVVLATGLDLRKKFGVISLLVTLPVLAYLLITHGANWLTVALIIVGIIPAFFSVLSDSLLEIVPRLHQDIKSLQRNQVEVGLGRLALSSLLLFSLPYTFIALIASGIPRIYGNYKLKSLSAKSADSTARPDTTVRKAIIKGVKQTLPIAVYHCLSGQISIWLISFFGTTASISQIGALGRLGVAFNLFTTLISTLVVPRFSRMTASKAVLLKRFLLIQVITAIIGIILISSIWVFSKQILWVLGKNYYGLDYELFLVAATNCIGLMVGICSQLSISRGWFLKPYFLIGLNFFSTLFSLVFFNISSLMGILYFTIAVSAMAYFLELTYALLSISKAEATPFHHTVQISNN